LTILFSSQAPLDEDTVFFGENAVSNLQWSLFYFN
jgi:hypothetical protein